MVPIGETKFRFEMIVENKKYGAQTHILGTPLFCIGKKFASRKFLLHANTGLGLCSDSTKAAFFGQFGIDKPMGGFIRPLHVRPAGRKEPDAGGFEILVHIDDEVVSILGIHLVQIKTKYEFGSDLFLWKVAKAINNDMKPRIKADKKKGKKYPIKYIKYEIVYNFDNNDKEIPTIMARSK